MPKSFNIWGAQARTNAGSQKYTPKSPPLECKTLGTVHPLSLNCQKELEIHLEITEDRLGGFGLRERFGRLADALARSKRLDRADLKFFGGPRGASGALFRSN